MEANANSYSPIDLTQIKKAKISNDKELENEIAKATEILKDTCKISRPYLDRNS